MKLFGPGPAKRPSRKEKEPRPLTEKEKHEQPVAAMGLATQTVNVLESHNLYTVGDLVVLTYKELRAMPHLGDKALQACCESLQQMGLSLRPEPEEKPADETSSD